MSYDVIPRAWESLMSSSDLIPVIVKSLDNFYDADWSMQPNTHDHFEMVFVKKGNAVFNIEGSSVDLFPNSIIIIKPNKEHKLVVKSKLGCEFIVLSFKFEGKMFTEYANISLDDFLNFVKGGESGPYLSINVHHKNEIALLLDRITEEKKSNDIGSSFLASLLVMELFVHISRALKAQWENSVMDRASKIRELVEASIGYMHENYQREIDLSTIARYVFLSTGYFTRAFKDVTGQAPINYLINMRLDYAVKLLTQTELRIGEIALQTGFSNQQRFNEAFKKRMKITPLQYRNKFTILN